MGQTPVGGQPQKSWTGGLQQRQGHDRQGEAVQRSQIRGDQGDSTPNGRVGLLAWKQGFGGKTCEIRRSVLFSY